MLKPLDSPEKTIRLIAEVSGAGQQDVRRRLIAEAEEIGTNVYEMMKAQSIPLYVPSEKLDNFYREADGFLYETTVWNTCQAKQHMRDFISSRLQALGRQQAQIFCFGDGLGFDSAYLASLGHHVRYFEPSLRCQQYAETVFRDNDVSVTTLSSLDDIQPGSLDVVVCLDVLEHVPDPQSLIRLFRSWLRPDGLLFVHAPFWFIHWTRPTHLKQNKWLSGSMKRMYSDCGFRAVDASLFWDPILLTPKENNSVSLKSLLSAFRIHAGRLLLSLGRGYSGIHMAIARRIARPPQAWVNLLKQSATAEVPQQSG
ncbi:MAG: methyltransferase domain-containing protein [Planctomycetaceae bacterium]